MTQPNFLHSFGFKACFEIQGEAQVRTASLGVEYRIEAETFVEGKKFSRVTFKNGRVDYPQIVNKTVNVRRHREGIRHCYHEHVFVKV